MLKRRFLFALVGLAYGVALAFWGMLISGGGHFNLPIMLFVSPFWFGLLFWPLWGFLSVRFNSLPSKLLFIFTMAAHFIGLVIYVRNPDNSDGYWFDIAMHDRTFILLPASAFLLYFVAQIFLWVRFVVDSFGRREFA